MRWLLAGLFFALAVVLAIGTAAIRADNVRVRREIEAQMRSVEDRIIEHARLSVRRIEAAAPERLAALQRMLLDRELERRLGRLQ